LTCKTCDDKPHALIAEGKAFMANALAICLDCEQLGEVAGIKQCQQCGCLVKFKIAANVLIKSKCPLDKW